VELEGEDEVLLGGRAMKTMRSLVEAEDLRLTGVIAPLIGKKASGHALLAVAGDVLRS